MSDVAQQHEQKRQEVQQALGQPLTATDQKVQVLPSWMDLLAGAPPQALSASEPVGDDSKKPEIEPGDAGAYEEVKGEAFVQGKDDAKKVNINDVKQGSLGDCYFLATLAAVARVRPDMIEKMVKDNGDGTWTVTFTDVGVLWNSAETVTVDSKFWVDGGDPVYAKKGDVGEKGPELWVMVIEKAWAQLHGGYGKILGGDSGKRDAWEAVTGQSASHEEPSDYSADELFEAVKKHFDAKKPAIFWSNKPEGEAAKKQEKDGVVGNHEYVLNGVNGDAKTFDLYNPWGSKHLNGVDAAFIQKHFQRVRFLQV